MQDHINVIICEKLDVVDSGRLQAQNIKDIFRSRITLELAIKVK